MILNKDEAKLKREIERLREVGAATGLMGGSLARDHSIQEEASLGESLFAHHPQQECSRLAEMFVQP